MWFYVILLCSVINDDDNDDDGDDEDKGIVMALIVTGIERSYVERDPRVILMERNEIDEQSVARYERAISEKLCPDERHCPLLLTGRRHDDDDDHDDDDYDDDGPSS
ncbi:hypothetical protein HZH68_016658 [Vespula germanica]|uniref:Uncharacterized protein n=1 Tax=Vespula germanica TaxID=30212 RepID=A0A834MNT2_VESGE|nr:hypothetical protein HZH68_016658 [Vespula germanica]